MRYLADPGFKKVIISLLFILCTILVEEWRENDGSKTVFVTCQLVKIFNHTSINIVCIICRLWSKNASMASKKWKGIEHRPRAPVFEKRRKNADNLPFFP